MYTTKFFLLLLYIQFSFGGKVKCKLGSTCFQFCVYMRVVNILIYARSPPINSVQIFLHLMCFQVSLSVQISITESYNELVFVKSNWLFHTSHIPNVHISTIIINGNNLNPLLKNAIERSYESRITVQKITKKLTFRALALHQSAWPRDNARNVSFAIFLR